MKKDIVKSHLKKKALSKLALSISLFIVLLTSTGYIFNSKGVIFLFYIFCLKILKDCSSHSKASTAVDRRLCSTI